MVAGADVSGRGPAGVEQPAPAPRGAQAPRSPGGAPRQLVFDHVWLASADAAADAPDRLVDVDLSIPLDGITVVVGPSGSGKSSLLRLCNRLEAPSRGRVLLDGADLATLDVLALRRRLGMVFQRPTLFPGTVRENLLVADPSGDERRHAAALERCGLPPGLLDREADGLSGGEAQRACLARTLLTDPDVLLCDEVTSSLDGRSRRVVEDLVRSLADDEGLGVLWVTHDLDQARRLADRTVVVLEGSVVPADVAEAYLAEAERADAVERPADPAGRTAPDGEA